MHVTVFGATVNSLPWLSFMAAVTFTGVAPDVSVEVLRLTEAHEQSTAFPCRQGQVPVGFLKSPSLSVGDLRPGRGRHAVAGIDDVVLRGAG